MKSFKQFTQLSEEEQLDEFLGGVFKSVGKAVKGAVGGKAPTENPNQGSRSMAGRAGVGMNPPASVAGGKIPPSVKFGGGQNLPKPGVNLAQKFDASGKSRFQRGIGEFAPKAPAAAPVDAAKPAASPAKPKPSPMNANRPGAPKANSGALSGKRPSDLLSKGGKVRKESFELEEGRAEDAKKSLEKVKKRQGVLDDYEKKTGKKLDINKSVEAREHKKNFPGAKRTGKKKRGEKESELETHNRRVNKYSERLRKYGKTKKQKKDDEAMAKHTSRFD
mgnify:CR=1 FL=1|tara:strand:- start:739 stop:1569 length:831 start_codon:yes stop_codon:yes gene_type:complete